jgi:hypothetical protein
MRRWGIVISVFYAAIVVALLGPGLALIAGHQMDDVSSLYTSWVLWVWAVLLVAGEALLLFLSVDTARRRLRPRRHILLSVITGGVLFALLSAGAVWSVDVALFGDDAGLVPSSDWGVLALWGGLWILWGWIFWVYLNRHSDALEKILSWLLKGSVLELLIAVPCHVVVRQRNECSAPMVSGFGIVTGIAVMLLVFGPGVLFLYRRRLEAYRKPGAPGD